MSALSSFLEKKLLNPSELETYSKLAPAGLASHPVTFLALYGKKAEKEAEKGTG